MARVRRPVVRSFDKRFVRECAAWVRAGGHAVLWDSPDRARLVLPRPDPDDPMDLGRWSIMDLGKSSYAVVRRGPLEGLATTPVPSDTLDIVRERATRDSIHRGPTRSMNLDCLACGSCCRSNDVILEKVDERRFARAGRTELMRPPLARRRRDGRIRLRLLPNGDCHHLGKDNRCAIYAIRPDACSQFPVGSECCLFAREEEMGIVDGLPPDD